MLNVKIFHAEGKDALRDIEEEFAKWIREESISPKDIERVFIEHTHDAVMFTALYRELA